MMLSLAAALAFAPPLDHPLRYTIVESTPLPGGGAEHFTLEEEARFARDGGGYTLTLSSVGWSSDAGRAHRDQLDAAIAPTIGVPIRYRLSADGDAVAVIDGDANWQAVISGLRASAALAGASPGQRAIAGSMAALPRHDRDLQLLEAVDDVVPRTHEGGHRVSDRPQPGGAVLHVVEDVDVSGESGLVLHRRRVREVRPAGGGTPIPLGASDVRLTRF
jgi:hypothetical protein